MATRTMLAVASLAIALLSAAWSSGCRPAASASSSDERIIRLEGRLDDLRQKLHIPGLSGAIVKDRKVLWAKGFGYADLDKKVPANPATSYRIASLTKTFASVLLLQLVEQGKLNLDDPIARFSPEFKERFGGEATVRHVFTHTSHDMPGQSYRYDGSRFSHLTEVIEKTSGKSFRELLVRNILDQIGMAGSVPGQDILQHPAKWTSFLDPPHVTRYESGLSRLAKPYRLYGSDVVQGVYPPLNISASAGLVSNVEDLARYDAAIDARTLVKKETLEWAWTPATSPDGRTLPYGLGWFITRDKGLRLVWHYGYWPDSFSSLYLKVPDSSLTFILLANSDGLSAPFRLGNGAVLQSAFANAFLRVFVSESVADSETTSHNLMSRWLDERRSSVRREITVDPAIYDKYVGEYDVEAGDRLTVTKESDRLFVQLFRFPKVEAFSEGNDRFFLKAQDMQVRFVRNAAGQIDHAEIRFWGRTLRAPKVK